MTETVEIGFINSSNPHRNCKPGGVCVFDILRRFYFFLFFLQGDFSSPRNGVLEFAGYNRFSITFYIECVCVYHFCKVLSQLLVFSIFMPSVRMNLLYVYIPLFPSGDMSWDMGMAK